MLVWLLSDLPFYSSCVKAFDPRVCYIHQKFFPIHHAWPLSSFYNFLKIDQQFHWSLPLNKGARTLPHQCSAINIPVKYGAFSSASYLKDSSVCFHIDVPLFHGLPSYLFNLLSNAEILGFAQLRWKLWLISELSS